MASMRFSCWSVVLLVGFGLLAAGVAVAQDEAKSDQTVAEKPAAQAASDEKQPIMARVIEVHGDVKHAPLDSQDYKPCQLDDEYPEGTKIITGVRSSIKLQIGEEEPYTCMLIEAVGKTLLSEAYKTKDTKKVRVGVGYGRIRAGVAEGGLKSDFTVDSPVATLSKRGTWGFTLFYERDTDFFQIGLTERGLVEVINKLTNERRTVNPKELITSAMRLWLEQARFERNVPIPDILGQGDIEVAFNRLQQSGLGVLDPGGGQAALLNLTTERAQMSFADLARGALPPGGVPLPDSRLRAEGFFGTGRGDELIDVMIESSNPLAQQGCARPGTYKFRRSALESWLQNYKGAKP
ncbi:MAG: hypothetical protein KKI02_12380 [Planctomycetes bacterium]|nr:hypothetical protein [Planctomycetota bacterium]